MGRIPNGITAGYARRSKEGMLLQSNPAKKQRYDVIRRLHKTGAAMTDSPDRRPAVVAADISCSRNGPLGSE